MMFCKDCGRIFMNEEVTLEKVENGDDVGYIELCPYCASEDVGGYNEDRF